MKRTISLLLSLLSAVLIFATLAWLTGRVVSDRFAWSQWLLWIPTPVAVACTCAVTLLAAIRRTRLRNRRVAAWATVSAGVLGYFAFIEHRFHALPSAAAGGVRVVHWNATPVRGERVEAYRAAMMQAAGDITILTDAGAMPWHESVQTWLGDEGVMRRSHPFTILSRIPLLSQRVLIARDEVYVLVLQFDTHESLGRPLTIYAVDMPSDLTRSRAELAREVRQMLDEMGSDAPTPDLVIGDFNITRNAASLAMMFPGYRHAFSEAGRGYGATFHTAWPLYHIDHALLSDEAHALKYDLFQPRLGRHLIQAVNVTLRSPQP